MGLSEIASLLDVSRQRAYQLSQAHGFPEPIARLSMGSVWRLEDVERWARDVGRL